MLPACGTRLRGTVHSCPAVLHFGSDIGHRSSISIHLQRVVIRGISINRCSSHSLRLNRCILSRGCGSPVTAAARRVRHSRVLCRESPQKLSGRVWPRGTQRVSSTARATVWGQTLGNLGPYTHRTTGERASLGSVESHPARSNIDSTGRRRPVAANTAAAAAAPLPPPPPRSQESLAAQDRPNGPALAVGTTLVN